MNKKTMNKNGLLPEHDGSVVDAFLPRLDNVTPTLLRLGAGTALFRQGDATRGIFRLVSGRIRLTRMTAAGAEVPMHTVRAGELFAEPSLFAPRYHCDAIALSDSDVLVYPKADLMNGLRQDPDALWAFAAALAHRVQNLRTRLELRQVRAAHERVLQALRLRCDATGLWKIDGTLKSFAAEIGLTHEALYRALARLEREGLIARADARIRVRKAARA